MSTALSEVTYSRLDEESKAYVEQLAWEYRVSESEAVRRIIQHARDDADDRDIFAAEVREARERKRKRERESEA